MFLKYFCSKLIRTQACLAILKQVADCIETKNEILIILPTLGQFWTHMEI